MSYLIWITACIGLVWLLSKSEKRHRRNKGADE